MATVLAIYENGDLRPLAPVDLPEGCRVRFDVRIIDESFDDGMDGIHEILDCRHSSGHTDTA